MSTRTAPPARTSLSTRIAVAVLVALAVVTASVTTYLTIKPGSAGISASGTASPAPEITAFATALTEVATDGRYPERHLTDLLDNRRFSSGVGDHPAALARALVLGYVSGATAGEGESVLVTFTVTSVISGNASTGPTILRAAALGPQALRALVALTPSDVFLIAIDGPRSPSAPLEIRQSGLFWIDARGGSLSPLMLDPIRGSEFLDGVATVEDLRDAASEPTTVRRILNGTIVP